VPSNAELNVRLNYLIELFNDFKKGVAVPDYEHPDPQPKEED
jgi:hypothetical protein